MILLDGKTIGNQGRVTYSSIVYLCSFVMLTFVLSFTSSFLSPSSASAINSSITLNLSSSTLSLDLTPKLGGGFAKSGNNTINVKTNHYTGYTLKITAGTNDTNSTKLVNIESNTTIDSIESNISEADFSANTDAAATSYNGKWGFMPSQYVTTDNTNPSSPVHTIVDNDPTGSNASNAVYLPAPDYATGTTLDITNSANPDTFNTYTISLGARAGMETTAGTYSNTFNILAIGNPIIYSITFSDNTGDSSITNLPTGTGSVSTSDIDILLPTTIPTRTGYDFIGWCKTETTTNGTVCPSNTPYPASVPAAGQTPAVPSYYEIDQTTDNTELTFYATWAPKTYSLTINFAGIGVSSVEVRTASGTGGTLMGTVSTSGGTVSNLTYGTNYYLYPTFTTGNVFSSWTKTSGAGTISSTSDLNPYFTIGAGDAAITITGKDECGGYICYYANGNDVVGTMGKQSVTDGYSKDLLASNYSRTGYGFAGWSDKPDYATNSSAKFYGPQENIVIPTGTSQTGLRLYAVWIQSAGSLQTDATAVCESLTTAPTDGTANLSSVSALTDQRDNNTYAIAKLADGNCWMIENLRLESTASHNSDGTLAQGYGTSSTYGDFGGLADAESVNFTRSTTANSLYYSGTQSGTASIDIGTADLPYFRMPRYNNANTSARASFPTSNNESMYSYGNYYTWHAAIADLTYFGGHNQSTTATSLCPSGWHIPKGGYRYNGMTNEQWSLVVDGINGGIEPDYGSPMEPYYAQGKAWTVSTELRAYPNNFLYSGLIDGSTVYNRGNSGNYWSSTIENASTTYILYLENSAVYPGTYSNYKYYGQSIRCVHTPPTIASAIYLQDITEEIVDNTPEGTTTTLKDKRDEQLYSVGKLADGNVWLLDNLALDLMNSTVLNGMNDNNTNASNTSLGYLKNGGGTTSDKYATTGVSDRASSSYSAPLMNLADKNTVPSDYTSVYGEYRVGGYYNYCAASAGSYCYGNGSSYGTSSGNATEDICPKGWRMPTGGPTGEYQSVYDNTNYNTYANYRSALHLPLSGYIYYSASGQGSSGSFWSSTRSNNYEMYRLYLDDSLISPSSSYSRYYWLSVRCVIGS